MHLLSLLSLLGLAAAVPMAPAPAKLASLDPYTGKVINSTSGHNSTFKSFSAQAAASSWWYAALDHSTGAVRDYVPNLYDGNGNPDYNYPTYIAVASGDSAGLTNAIYSQGPNGDRYNGWLAGQPRTIYLAPGTYTLSQTLYMDTDTVIIGDAANPPTIKAASGFNGDYLIVAGVGGTTGNGGELKFSLMLKNLILDTTANSGASDFTALSWRVAQNSALVNMQINMPQGAHTGIYMGQGSTIQLGDVSFSYGSVGLYYAGSQQASLKNLKFSRCTTGILIDGGNTVSIFAPTFDTVGRSIVFNSGAPWVSIIDGTSTNSGTFFTSNVGYPNFMLENISKDTTNTPMAVVDGATKIGGVTSVGTYVYGNTYGANPIYQSSPSVQTLSRPAAIATGAGKRYPVSSASQYASATINDVINLKDTAKNGGQTLAGDGSTDDGAALQAALNTAASAGKIAYLPYGTYRTTQTITIPVGTRLVGNGWSTIAGAGSLFSDDSNPQPVVKIGNSGDVGTCDIQDIRFTVAEQLPGAIIVEVNMAGNSPGDVAIHNSLITVGGTRDTSIDCSSEATCKAAYLGMHLTASSSAYIDNFWAWVADHNTDNDDGKSNKDTRIAAKGGVLIEATKGTWISGLGKSALTVSRCSACSRINLHTGSEHFWLHQLSYNNAANVFNNFFQSETNYHQGTLSVITPPAPFTATSSDPSFSWCTGQAVCPMGAAQYFNGGSNILGYGAGSWNFFGGFQASMNVINKSPTNLKLYGSCDHIQDDAGGHFVFRLPDGTRFGDGRQGENDGYGGSWGSLVAQYMS